MRSFQPFLIAIVFSAGSTTAAAQPQPQPMTAEQKAYLDYMNERVCESITVTGSRLGAKKVCRTRAQWAEQRLEDKQSVERVQTVTCTAVHSNTGAVRSC